jgi:hypothetical protein
MKNELGVAGVAFDRSARSFHLAEKFGSPIESHVSYDPDSTIQRTGLSFARQVPGDFEQRVA